MLLMKIWLKIMAYGAIINNHAAAAAAWLMACGVMAIIYAAALAQRNVGWRGLWRGSLWLAAGAAYGGLSACGGLVIRKLHNQWLAAISWLA
jgi:hypothetical protein